MPVSPPPAEMQHLSMRSGMLTPGRRALPQEVPVALSFGGTTQAVMMATPADFEDFGIGFALTEGIALSAADIEALEVVSSDLGHDVQMRLVTGRQSHLAARRRLMAGPVGCGLCGIDSIEEALRDLPVRQDTGFGMDEKDVLDAVAALSPGQKLKADTGSVHAAGFYRPGKGMILVREDIGRHNALDKLVGALARCGETAANGALVISSRVSVDMVQKAVVAGAPVLIAVSSPTDLAVRTAAAAGMTLVAMARGQDFEIFTRADRIAPESSTAGKHSDVA